MVGLSVAAGGKSKSSTLPEPGTHTHAYTQEQIKKNEEEEYYHARTQSFGTQKKIDKISTAQRQE